MFTVVFAWGCLFLVARGLSRYRFDTAFGPLWGMPDDVYISAAFARTFAHGGGLRWYPGAPAVEGFSNPLWVLVLALLHVVPGFREDDLGLYVGILNGLMILLIACVFVDAVTRATGPSAWSWPRAALALALAWTTSIALCFWAGSGFETTAIALLALTAFREALAPAGQLRLPRIALLIALAFWTRIDAIIPCSAAILTVARRLRWSRSLLLPSVGLVALTGSQFPLRRWYFGEWLPNTYYLKATGWPFADRVTQGLLGSFVPVLLLLCVVVPCWRFMRSGLGSAALPVTSALITYGLSLGYSIHNGGDLAYFYGYDRFTAIGSIFLGFAVVSAAFELRMGPLRASGLALLALLVTTGPTWILRPNSLATLADLFDLRKPSLPTDQLMRGWADDGKRLREVLQPNARIATCGAGAVIYFSHRGGVDLLGKVEPIVAHQPVRITAPPDTRCWRRFPGAGHNKEDVRAVFEQREPDASLLTPPESQRARYERVRVGNLEFFALRESPLVRWSKLAVARDPEVHVR